MTATPTQQGPGDHRWCDAQIAALTSRVQALEEQVAAAMAQVAELKERLGKNSRNSSRPPSTDPPSEKSHPKKQPSGRKPGGQPGHPPNLPPLAPEEQVSKFVPIVPQTCPDCGGPVDKSGSCPDRHQVWILPKIVLTIIEYLLFSGVCRKCGKTVKGQLPAGVQTGRFDPTLTAFLVLLTGAYRLSKGKAAALFKDLTGMSICKASVVACEQTVSEAVAAPVAEAHAFAQQQPAGSVDETPWKQGKSKSWLWVLVTPLVTVFRIDLHRTTEAAKALLGAFGGILSSDRYRAYVFWPMFKRQFCWAHLKRDFTAIAERLGNSRRIGVALLKEQQRLFRWWRKLKEGKISRSTFQHYVAPLKERVRCLLVQGAASRNQKTAGMCRELLDHLPSLWTFVYVEGIEPTNNAAERALRHAVLWRRCSFGTQSEKGSRFVERILTVEATLRQQGRDVLDYLTRACEAAIHGTSAPSLLPQQGDSELIALRA